MSHVPELTWANVSPFLVVFAAMFLLDFVWTFYTKAIQRHAAFAAANWAVMITLFNGAAQIGYVENHWLLIPAGLGAFGGTYAALKWGRH